MNNTEFYNRVAKALEEAGWEVATRRGRAAYAKGTGRNTHHLVWLVEYGLADGTILPRVRFNGSVPVLSLPKTVQKRWGFKGSYTPQRMCSFTVVPEELPSFIKYIPYIVGCIDRDDELDFDSLLELDSPQTSYGNYWTPEAETTANRSRGDS